MTSAPILIIDDDPDDKDLIGQVCRDLNILNELLFFSNGADALAYMRTATRQPFLIVCDINMPSMTGIELRRILENNEMLKAKTVPFIFLSTSVRQQDINEAYDLNIQGYFEKGNDFDRFRKRLKLIFDYWTECKHPVVKSPIVL